jgi:hypothetical protein
VDKPAMPASENLHTTCTLHTSGRSIFALPTDSVIELAAISRNDPG